MNILDNQKIELNNREAEQVLISLLVSNLAANKFIIRKEIERELKSDLKENISKEILNAELKKFEDEFVETQYSIMAEIIQKYSNTQSDASIDDNERSAEPGDLTNTFALGFIIQSKFDELSNKFGLVFSKLDQLLGDKKD